MNAGVDPTRLYTTLTNTGLRQKDPILYQLLYNLIGTLANLKSTVEDDNSGGGGSTDTTTITQIIQQLTFGDDSGEGGDGPPGQRGLDGAQGIQGPMGPMGAIIFPPDAEDGDIYPAQIGPQGNPGITGAAGAVGPPGLPSEDGPEGDTIRIPGVPGPQGNPGVAGTVGPVGLPYIAEDGLEGDPGLFIVTTPPVPPPIYSYIYRDTAQTIPDSVTTPISFSNAAADASFFWSAGSPTRLTVPTGLDGTYLILGQVEFVVFPGTGLVSVTIFKNGSRIAEVENNVTGIVASIQVSVQEVLAATDYIELEVHAVGTAGTYDTVGGSRSTFLQLTKAAAVSGSSNSGGGALVFLEEKIASSSSSLDFTSVITSAYDEYVIELIGVLPATNNVDLNMRLSTDGGSSYDATTIYATSVMQVNQGTFLSALNGGLAQTAFVINNTVVNTATNGVDGTIKLFDPASTVKHKRITLHVETFKNDSNLYTNCGGGRWASATAVNAFRFLFSSGNIASGTIRIYGVKKSGAISSSGGKLVQVVNTQTGAVTTGSTIIPFDDTIPQNGEGNEYMTLSIAPISSTNKLKIEIVIHISFSVAGNWLTAALFQDSVADAIAASAAFQTTGTAFSPITFTHYMTAGTTSSTTFKVRGGANNAGTTTFNGQSTARRFGGVIASSITISEIVP